MPQTWKQARSRSSGIFCRSMERITSSFTSATRDRRRIITARLLASSWPPIAVRRRAARPGFVRAGAGQDSLRADHAAAARSSDRRARLLHGDGVRDIALWVDDAEAAWRETTKRGARGVREPETVRDEHGEVRMASIAPMAIRSTRSSSARIITGAFLPGFAAMTAGHCGAAGGVEIHRPHGGQRRLEPDEPVGGFLSRRDGLSRCSRPSTTRIFRTEYSALMSKVMSNGNGAREISDQRTGRGQTQIADRGVSGFLSRSGRAAHRHGDGRHYRRR